MGDLETVAKGRFLGAPKLTAPSARQAGGSPSTIFRSAAGRQEDDVLRLAASLANRLSWTQGVDVGAVIGDALRLRRAVA